MSERVRFC